MPFQTHFVDVAPGVRIATLLSFEPSSNDGIDIATPAPAPAPAPTVVFLHFWGGSSNTWSLVNATVSRHTRTAAMDFRGWGRSSGPDEADAYSISTLASDVAATMAALHLGPVILVGLSMGAKVAQVVASSLRADQLCGLILVSPAPASPLRLPPAMRQQQMHAFDDPQNARFVAANVLTESFRDRDLPDFVIDDMLAGNRWARKAWPAYAMAEDVSDVLGHIKVPVLVLAAEGDSIEPVQRVRTQVCEKIPGAIMEVVSGSGHLSPLDAPDAVADRILRFVDGLRLAS